MKTFRLQKSMCPVLLCVPHAGTFVPPEIAQTLTTAGLQTKANWFLMEKIDSPKLQACGLVASNIARNVIDLDCDPEKPEVCPLETVNRKYIYREGHQLTTLQIAQHVEHYWQPFHDQLESELHRMVEKFGNAKLILITSNDFETKDSFIKSKVESNFSPDQITVGEAIMAEGDSQESVEAKLSALGAF